MTQSEYWKNVAELARDVSRPPSKLEEEYGTDDVSEILDQAVDNHVIYYSDAFSIMRHTANEDAHWEQTGAGPEDKGGFYEMMPALAYFAMQADVYGHKNFDPQEDEDEDEDDWEDED